MTANDYYRLLEQKITFTEKAGFDVSPAELSPHLFEHQKDAVMWGASLGRALIAMSFGLGKSRIQCELARLIVKRTGQPFLIICPLGVKHQFQEEDGPVMGTKWVYVRDDEEVRQALEAGECYLITNYERVRDGNIQPGLHSFAGVSLDEGSILRSLGSKTYDVFTDIFAAVPYRYIATATPSPNEYTELLGYAQFLGIMERGQALTRFFKRDTTKAGHLTIHPQHEKEFWLWIASFSLFLFKPSDLSHPDDGYVLPEMKTNWHRIDVDQRRAWAQTDNYGQRLLLLNPAGGVRQAAAEKRETLNDRLEKVRELLSQHPDEQLVVWCHLNAEQAAIEKLLLELGISCSSIHGSLSIEESERRLYQWLRKETTVLLSKPVMLGSGVNLQQCHTAIFIGIDYKFQDFVQAIHRVYRFLQVHPVNIHIIYAESEEDVVKALLRKWEQHNRQVETMRGIMLRYGLSHAALRNELKMSIGVVRDMVKGKLFTAVNNDCVLEVRGMADNSIGLELSSIPFGNHYSYTTKVEDFGHNPSDAEFWKQMDFLIPELLRILKPGRVAAIHVKDRILYGHQTRSGFMEVSPFSDECVMAFRKHGFMYEGRRTITTDVVRENNSTYRLGWTEMTRDASKMGSGLPEYLLLFRKPPSNPDTARADEPVVKSKQDYTRARWQIDAHAYWRSNGDRPLFPDELYDYEAHVARLQAKEDAGNLPATFFYEPPKSPSEAVWDDINPMLCLNSEQTRNREENHICPLPFDIVERVIMLYSNPGDVVLDMFAGLFTVVMKAIELGRIGYGIELNEQYYAAGVRYCQEAERNKLTPSLFDWLKVQQAQQAAAPAGD
jgi:DNA modification methylase/superfamily II DNA or RNA helicase